MDRRGLRTSLTSHLANDTLMQAVEAGAANMNVTWARP